MIDQEIVEGEKVTFELGLSHDDVQGEWSVNGEVVKNSDDVEIACPGRLEVIEAPYTFTAPINDTALEN